MPAFVHTDQVQLHCVLVIKSPVGMCVVFQGVFRITTKENVEYLLQAANEEEREEWTTAIANTVRRLDIKFKVYTVLFNRKSAC